MSNAYGKIIANVEQLHRLMDEEGISAIVARSGKNFTYLAGFAYPGTLARHLEFPDSPREVLLVWGYSPDFNADEDGAGRERRRRAISAWAAGRRCRKGSATSWPGWPAGETR